MRDMKALRAQKHAREDYALALHEQGKSYAQIGDEMNVTHGRVWQLLRAARDRRELTLLRCKVLPSDPKRV